MDGPVEIRVLPLGESGIVGKARLTEHLAESMASYWALPESERRRRFGGNDIAYLAARLRVTPAFVRKHQRNPRVLAGIRKRVNEAVTLLMPEIVHAQAQKAILLKDTTAAKFLADMGGYIKAGGITVQQNVGLNLQMGGIRDSIQEDKENLDWLKGLKKSGYLDRIEDAVIVKEDDATGTDGDRPGTTQAG